MAKVTLLHLTDLHFGWDTDPTQAAQRTNALNSLLKTLADLPDGWKPQIICLTGDVGWKGATSDYTAATVWLSKLLSVLKLAPSDVVACAGNHDVDRRVAVRHARPADPAQADMALAPPLSAVATYPAFSAYSAFCKEFGIRPYRLNEEESFLVGTTDLQGLRFVGFNTAWYCQGNDDQKKLWVGLPFLQFLEAHGQTSLTAGNSGPPTICLMHHPPDWWVDDETHATPGRPNTMDYLAHRCHLILSGHTHGEVRKADRIAQSALHMTGGASYAGGNYHNSVRLIRVGETALEHRSFEFDPRSPTHEWKSAGEAQRVPFVERPPERTRVAGNEATSNLEALRDVAARLALATVEQRSRQIKRDGGLPTIQTLFVALRVTEQLPQFDEQGRMTEPKDATDIVPLWEACHVSGRRRTLLLGDLGSGKTTLAAQLVSEALGRERHTLALLVAAKAIRLPDVPNPMDVLTAVGCAFRAEAGGNCPDPNLSAILEGGDPVFLIIDGLDEIPRRSAAGLLRLFQALTESWPALRLLVTGRPVELSGIDFQSWTICRFEPLGDDERLLLLQAEAAAAGVPDPEEEAERRLASLKRRPTLDAIATTPLAIRLLYKKLEPGEGTDFSLGDLLYELLVERLAAWDEKEGKEAPVQQFCTACPDAETRAVVLGQLVQATRSINSVTAERAVEALRGSHIDQPTAVEALHFFRRAGFVSGEDELAFAFQPLMDVASGLAWLTAPPAPYRLKDDHLEDWRGVSFAASIARRRGSLDRHREWLEACLTYHLREAGGILPASQVVAESRDPGLARWAVHRFSSFGRRPITGGQTDWDTPLRAVAETVRLAGDAGFEWMVAAYFDPRFPVVWRGSVIPEGLLKQWAWFSRKEITDRHRERLRPLVAPLLRCGGLIDFLPTLVHLVPDEFSEAEHFWYLARGFEYSMFADEAVSRFRRLISPANRNIARDVLCRLPTPRAIELYLELHDEKPDPAIVRAVMKWRAGGNSIKRSLAVQREVLARLGQPTWDRLLLWFSTEADGDRSIHADAASLLFDAGEHRLEAVGAGLMAASYARLGESDKRLDGLLTEHGEVGVRWLIRQIEENTRLGGCGAWWAIFLRHLETYGLNQPELLRAVLPHLTPAILLRNPEVRYEFKRALKGPYGDEVRRLLRYCLLDAAPKLRAASAAVLVVTDPACEPDALAVLVLSRELHRWDAHGWESFILGLAFGPGILTALHERLGDCGRYERAFGLAVLHRHGSHLTEAEFNDFLDLLLDSANWELRSEQDGRSVFATDRGYQFLLTRFARPTTPGCANAAAVLLELHSTRLDESQESRCWEQVFRNRIYNPEPVKQQLLRVLDDAQYRDRLRQAMKSEGQDEGVSVLTEALAVAENSGCWDGLVWELFCANRGLGGETEDVGELLLEIGTERQTCAQAIGAAARKHLTDPRLDSEYRAETRQWLALLAHEFGGFPSAQLEPFTTLPVLHPAAQRALLNRMGNIPAGVTYRNKSVRDFPDDLGERPPEPNPLRPGLDGLMSLGRSGDHFHPNTCEAIEQCLLDGAAPAISQTEEIAAQGVPGLLIAESLRFCCGLPASPTDQAELVGSHLIPFQWRSEPNAQRLLTTAARIRATALMLEPWKEQYAQRLRHIIRRLSNGLIPVAVGVLEVGGDLDLEELDRVFEDLARNPSRVWDDHFGVLVGWEGLYVPDRREGILTAVRRCLGTLAHGAGGMAEAAASPFPYLYFPLIEFALSATARAEALGVYMRGLSILLASLGNPQAAQQSIRQLADLEPLLSRIPNALWAEIGRAVSQFRDPGVRSLLKLTGAFLDGNSPNGDMPDRKQVV